MPTRRQLLVGGIGVVTSAAMPLAWYGGIYEPGDIEIIRRGVAMRNVPSRLDGLTAVQFSDLHLSSPDDTHQRMIDLINGLKPHMIFFTGDLVDERSAIGGAVDIFHQLEAPGGIWAVPGNWDHTADAVDALRLEPPVVKVRLLINESQEIEGGRWLIGVDDPASSMDDVGSALHGVRFKQPSVILAHAPEIADNIVDVPRFDLILVGHIHGGQINLPVFSGA